MVKMKDSRTDSSNYSIKKRYNPLSILKMFCLIVFLFLSSSFFSWHSAIADDPDYYFEISGTNFMTAGQSCLITITAKDSEGEIYTDYNGEENLIFSGAEASPDGTNPTASDSLDEDIEFGNETAVQFNNGIGTSTLKLYKATLHSSTINVTDGDIATIENDTPTGLDYFVYPAEKSLLLWVNEPAEEAVTGEVWPGFSIKITDEYHNRNYDDDEITVSASQGDLNGTVTKNAVFGKATFYDISYDEPANITVTGTAIDLTDTPASQEIEVYSPWLSGWEYRKKLSINHDYIDEDLTDFPILVVLDEDDDIGNAARDDGYDIRFTLDDNYTLLDYERETWSGGDGDPVSAEIWVNVPFLSSDDDTNIYIYYGKADAEDGEEAEDVWDDDYAGVWHKNDFDDSNIHDSTSNENHGAKTSANHPQETDDGIVGSAQLYNDDYNYIAVGTDGMSTDNGTVSLWFYLPNDPPTTARWRFFGHVSPLTNWSNRIFLGFDGEDSGHHSDFYVGLGDDWERDTRLFLPVRETWYFVALTWDDDGNYVVFRDGEEISSGTYSGLNEIASQADIGNTGRTDDREYEPDGIIDEVRTSSVARSEAWIKAKYHAVLDDLITIDSEEKVPVPETPSNVSPEDETIVDSFTPTLTASNYSCLAGTTHNTSQWQITTIAGDYSDPVFDSGVDSTNLESIDIPADTLEGPVIYYWRVRYRNSESNWSRYSAETAFMTEGASTGIFPGFIYFGDMLREEQKEMENDNIILNVVSPSHNFNISIKGSDLEDRYNAGNYIPINNMEYSLNGGGWESVPDSYDDIITDEAATGFGYQGKNYNLNYRLTIPGDALISEYRGSISVNVTVF